MSEVGIRALKQNASKVVARAKAGESITITEHGRPVARIVPIRKTRMEELIEVGLATPRTRDIRDLPTPAPRRHDEAPASEVLEQMRQEERY